MNFDYFVERAQSTVLNEMASAKDAFSPRLSEAYKHIYNLVKFSGSRGTGVNQKNTSSIRVFLYDYIHNEYFRHLPNFDELQKHFSIWINKKTGKVTSNERFAWWIDVVGKLVKMGLLDEQNLINFFEDDDKFAEYISPTNDSSSNTDSGDDLTDEEKREYKKEYGPSTGELTSKNWGKNKEELAAELNEPVAKVKINDPNASEEDRSIFNAVTKDDSLDIERNMIGIKKGLNRRMRKGTKDTAYNISANQFAQIQAYLYDALMKAGNESRKIKRANKGQSPDMIGPESVPFDLDDPNKEITHGVLDDSLDELYTAITKYRKLLQNQRIDLEDVVDEDGDNDEIYRDMVTWDSTTFNKLIKSTGDLFKKLVPAPTVEQVIKKLTNISDVYASSDKALSNFYKALRDIVNDAQYDYESYEPITTGGEEEIYNDFETSVVDKYFGKRGTMRRWLFDAWYNARNIRADYNLEQLDLRKDKNFSDAMTDLKALASGQSVVKNTTGQNYQSIAILKKEKEIEAKKRVGYDTSKDEEELEKMRVRLSTMGNVKPVDANDFTERETTIKAKLKAITRQLQFLYDDLNKESDPEQKNLIQSKMDALEAEQDKLLGDQMEMREKSNPVQEAVMSYMEEQTQRDNKFGTQKGKFIDRGFKKVNNYSHWLMINE